MQTSDFSTLQLKAINDGAIRAYNVGKGLLELADCQQEAWLWVCENMKLVKDWAEKDKRNDKLKSACYHAGLHQVRDIMRQNGQSERQDFATYAVTAVQDLLPTIFETVTFQTGPEVNDEIRHKTPPDEGGTGLAMVVDVKRGFISLPQEQKKILFLLYSKPDARYSDVAKEMDMSEATVRRREQRALEGIVDALGGPRVERIRKQRSGV
jgi:DNA-directed RNA polymerase specialized sigma24 family protein